MDNEKTVETTFLKTMLAIYILMAFILAGLNFGYAEQAPAHIATLIKTAWHFYENELKTIFIGLGGYLTIRIIARNSRTTMRKKNLIGFLITALVVHISGPYLLKYPDL